MQTNLPVKIIVTLFTTMHINLLLYMYIIIMQAWVIPEQCMQYIASIYSTGNKVKQNFYSQKSVFEIFTPQKLPAIRQSLYANRRCYMKDSKETATAFTMTLEKKALVCKSTNQNPRERCQKPLLVFVSLEQLQLEYMHTCTHSITVSLVRL